MLGLPLPLWKPLWCLFRRRKRRVTTRLPLSLWPRLGLYHLHSSLLSGCCLWTMVLAEAPCSCCVWLPSGGCCVTPAASLTHKEELRRRGGAVNVWRQGISRKQAATLYTAQANKRMRLPLCLGSGPSCCCGIQEVGRETDPLLLRNEYFSLPDQTQLRRRYPMFGG